MGNFKEYWDLARKYPAFQGGFIWDFVDQAIIWPSKNGKNSIYAFGGDFNEYDGSDGSFNCNGVIAADRTLHPHSYEVKYQYRNILTTKSGDRPGRVSIFNENFFKDLGQYRLIWTLFVEGDAVASGIVENLKAGPQKSEIIDLRIPPVEAPGKDIYINLSYVLKTADGLLPAGYEVAYDQIKVQEGSARVFTPGSATVPGSGIGYSESATEHVFSGEFAFAGLNTPRAADWKAVFDKKTGFLSGYSVNGKEMIAEPLMPEFSRALVENDMGASLYRNDRMGVWRYLDFKLRKLDVAESLEGWNIAAEYEPVAGNAAIVKLTYLIRPDGSIEGHEIMKDAGSLSQAPDLFRYGMKFTMPGRYSTLDFYGNGPWENYSDRNSSALTGHYVQSVNDQYHYGYVRTQESGTHTGMKYLRLLDSGGCGLEISSTGLFSASALPFPLNVLDCMENGTPVRKNKANTQAGEPRHSLDLKAIAHENDREAGLTYVDFDLVQMGVGGINSWGTIPLEQYRVHAAERDFTYFIRPFGN